MHFDALTLACVTTELRTTICPGRVQQVLLVDEHSIGMEIFAGGERRQLLLSARPSNPRAHLVSYKLRRGVERETPLLLLLRKYVRDALLTAVEQPDPAERVLQLAFSHRQHGDSLLVVELIGRQSNLCLTKTDGHILDSLQRSGAHRTLAPRQTYVLPPRPAKLAPLDDGSGDYYARLETLLRREGKLWKAVVDGVAGISPTAAREISWRAAGDSEAAAAHVPVLAVAHALQELWLPVQTGSWTAGLVYEEGAAIGFAPYPLHFRGEFVPAASISSALEIWAGHPRAERAVPTDPYAGQRAAVGNLLRRARRRVERQLEALAGDEPAPGAAERLRREAEWLLALASQIEPGQQWLQVDLGEADPLRIALDPLQSPIDQAQQRFKRAGRLERAASFIPKRRAQLQEDLDYLGQLEHDLGEAADHPEITAVRAALAETGLTQHGERNRRARASAAPKGGPLRLRCPQGFEILVGRNARQNDGLTFRQAHPDDLWLHARGVPGAHVIVRLAGREPDEDTIRVAGQLAAFHSPLRNERTATVICVRRRQVTRAPGGRPGQVLVHREEVITVPALWPDGVFEVTNS